VSITKTGAGKAILGGTQAYSGNTTVNGGVLQLNGSAVWGGALSGPGTTDITGGAVVFDYNDGSADPAATIKSILTTAYASNFASGQIHSSTAVANQIGLGWRDDTAAKQVTVLRALYGDANLSGTVDTIDFNLLVNSFSQTGKNWADADFNYDGTVNTVDFNLLASNFSKSLAGTTAGSAGGLVPEPASFALTYLMLGTLSARRRKRI
jgi:autotransporter-associated beta strand protein